MFFREINDDLFLALVQPSFAKDYLRIIKPNQTDFSRFLPWAASELNEDFFLKYVNKSLHSYADSVTLPCSIICHDELVGNIDFHQIDYSVKKANIGYWLDPKYRGHGIVAKSVQAFVNIGFNEMDLAKIEIWTSIENKDSCAVAERAGFTQESVRTKNDSELCDKVGYGLSK